MNNCAQQIIEIESFQQKRPVLLELSHKDEALRYFAKALAINRSGEFVVYLAESSKLLDLIRSMRCVEVLASFDQKSCYVGLLSPISLPAPAGSSSVALTVKYRADDIIEQEVYLNPVT